MTYSPSPTLLPVTVTFVFSVKLIPGSPVAASYTAPAITISSPSSVWANVLYLRLSSLSHSLIAGVTSFDTTLSSVFRHSSASPDTIRLTSSAYSEGSSSLTGPSPSSGYSHFGSSSSSGSGSGSGSGSVSGAGSGSSPGSSSPVPVSVPGASLPMISSSSASATALTAPLRLPSAIISAKTRVNILRLSPFIAFVFIVFAPFGILLSLVYYLICLLL